MALWEIAKRILPKGKMSENSIELDVFVIFKITHLVGSLKKNKIILEG